MSLGQHHPDAVLHIGHPIAGLERHTQQIDAVAAVISLLHERQRNHNGLFRTAVDSHGTRRIIDSHDLVERRIYLYALSTRVASTRKETLIDALSDDAHTPSLGNVHLIDEPSIA